MELTNLPYPVDAAELAGRFSDLPGFVFLESGGHRGGAGRWDIISALPEQVFPLPDTFQAVTDWMQALEAASVDALPETVPAEGVFAGSIIGLLDYDSASLGHGIAADAARRGSAGLYRWALVLDHLKQQAQLQIDQRTPLATRQTVLARLDGEPRTPGAFALSAHFAAGIDRSAYRSAVLQIQDYIGAGDCYQVNFAHRFHAGFSGDLWTAYLRLRRRVSGDFAAFLRLDPAHTVLSLSPERFLSIAHGEVVSQPIKGTLPRHPDPGADTRAAQALLDSAKDRAENVMITDLLRNDLGRFCEPGSVQVPTLCALESYANVHHLVSTVTGRLRAGVSPGSVMLGCSPGGSITGAPKRRAMEIIHELEAQPRGAYCGSVFVIKGREWLQSSIAIRTLEATGDELVCWGGGGITADSEWAAEYQETLDKVGALMAALEGQ